MSLPSHPPEQHRVIAATFGERVAGVTDWAVPTPVPEWTARDVVGHLIEWFPGFLAGGCDVTLPTGPTVDTDPVAAWDHHAAAVQAVLDDPATTSTVFAHPELPETQLDVAIAQFYTADVFMHTWDLARATGQDDTLDRDFCEQLYQGMLPMVEVLRQSGQYGVQVPVPDDADSQTRLLGFIGRDPDWRPPA